MTTAEDEESEYKCHNCQILCKRGDPSLIRAIGNIYHRQCFRCDFCQASVIEKFYLLELDSMLEEEMNVNNIILCEKDYYKHSRFKCHQCNGDIKNDHFQIIGPHKYHQHCLHCPGCTVLKNHVQTAQMDYEKENEPKKYFDYNGRPYCRYHYSLIKGTECVGCRQAILYPQPPTKRSEPSINPKWHPECYKMKKFWNIQLIDLQPLHPSVYKSEKQLISVQNEFESKRIRIWKEISQFENNVSKALSVIVQCKQQSEEFHACQVLLRLINILFTVLDSLFEHITHLSCDDSVQRLSDQLVSFLDVLCLPYAEQGMDSKTKMVNAILDCIRDLVKLSLQQAFILERNFGEAARYNSIIHQMLIIFSNNQYKKIMEMASLDHHFQLIDMAITRLGFVLNINPQQQGGRPDQTLLYKSPTTTNRPSLSVSSNQKKMVSSSTTDIHRLTSISMSHPNTLQRSRSTSKPIQQPLEEKTSNSRMESIRRALTTSRRKDSKAHHLRDHRSFSLHEATKPPLYISLPNIEQLNHTTPPLSPPTANQPTYAISNPLPELSQHQDSIIRHIAIICMESHLIEDDFVLDDLLAVLDTKKSSSSMATTFWGKLKTHILTPTTEPSAPVSLPSPTASEKKIGVSLSNLSSGSLNPLPISQPYKRASEHALFEKWKSMCPSIAPCFSSNSLAPHFLRDCVLAMIQQDLNTEGIFRKNGNIRGLKEMCETLDSQPNREDWTDFFGEMPIIQLAAFIKRFLRELPEPLLTYKLYKLFLMSNKANSQIESLTIIHYAICLLPKANRDILFLLLSLLNWVSRYSETNKMDVGNLARVIAPNIMYEPRKQTTYDIGDVSLYHGCIKVVSVMIQHYDKLMKIPTEFNVILEHPKLAEYLFTNGADLASSKHFLRAFNGLLKLKKEIMSSNHVIFPPSPSISPKYH